MGTRDNLAKPAILSIVKSNGQIPLIFMNFAGQAVFRPFGCTLDREIMDI
jgi:hypothetical protein